MHNDSMEKHGFYAIWHKSKLTNSFHWIVLILFCCSILNLALTGVAKSTASEPESNLAAVTVSKGKSKISEDQILVKFKDETSKEKRDKALTKNKLKKKSEIDKIKVEILTIDKEEDTAEEVVARLLAEESDSIEFAEVDVLVPPAFTPNDSLFPNQWALSQISAPAAWDMTLGSPSVIIAIADTGTDCNHEDLTSKCVPGRNVAQNNTDTSDVMGHGTKTSGTAGAAGNNAIGVASVCPNCKIMPVRIAYDSSGYANYSAMASAIVYAADNGAKVVNISYAIDGGGSSAISSAANYMVGKGGTVVVAAGNAGLSDSSSDNPSIIRVSATDQNDTLYGWSSYGNNIDISAPGCVDTTLRGGGYGGGCGTSYAAPMTSGVLGLLYSIKPNVTSYEAMSILRQSADDKGAAGWDSQYGWGRLNAQKAVSLAGGSNPPPPQDTTAPSVPANIYAAAISSSQINLSWSASTDNVGVTGYTIFRNGTQIATNINSTSYQNTGLSPSTSYSYTVKAYDAAGNTSVNSTSVSTTTLSSNPVTNSQLNIEPASLNFSATAGSDPTPSYRAISITNTGTASASWTGSPSQSWCSTNPASGTLAPSATSLMNIAVNKMQVAGTYNCMITFTAPNSTNSQTLNITYTVSPVGDTSIPTTPSNLSASAPNSSQINLSWSASTDNVSVTGYQVWRNNVRIATTTTTVFTDNQVSASATYTYTVRAFDSSYNYSAPSNAATVTVPAPTPVLSISTYSVTKTASTATIRWTTNLSSIGTVKYGTSPSNLNMTISDNTSATNHEVRLSGLSRSTTYYYRIEAYSGTLSTFITSSFKTSKR